MRWAKIASMSILTNAYGRAQERCIVPRFMLKKSGSHIVIHSKYITRPEEYEQRAHSNRCTVFSTYEKVWPRGRGKNQSVHMHVHVYT